MVQFIRTDWSNNIIKIIKNATCACSGTCSGHPVTLRKKPGPVPIKNPEKIPGHEFSISLRLTLEYSRISFKVQVITWVIVSNFLHAFTMEIWKKWRIQNVPEFCDEFCEFCEFLGLWYTTVAIYFFVMMFLVDLPRFCIFHLHFSLLFWLNLLSSTRE